MMRGVNHLKVLTPVSITHFPATRTPKSVFVTATRLYTDSWRVTHLISQTGRLTKVFLPVLSYVPSGYRDALGHIAHSPSIAP
jgi:hypothetical protein